MNSNSNVVSLASSTLYPRLASSVKWTNLPTAFTEKAREVLMAEFSREARRGDFVVEGRIYPEEMVLRLGYLEHGRLRQCNFEASIDIKSSTTADASGLAAEASDEAAGTATADAASSAAPANAAGGTTSDTTGDRGNMDKLYLCLDALGGIMHDHFSRLTPGAKVEDEVEREGETADGENIDAWAGEDEDEDDFGGEEALIPDLPEKWEAFDFDGDIVYIQTSSVNSQLEAEASRLIAEANGDTQSLVNETSISEELQIDELQIAEDPTLPH